MRQMFLATAALIAGFASAEAAQLDARSAMDAVTVYPDGATVVRVIRADLAAGDTTIVARDFPPTLDPSSLRVEGEAGARLVIGAIDARAPRADRPPIDPALERRIEALRDERGALDDKIAAATARRKFAERFAETTPAGLGDKAQGPARPLSEWREAFQAVADEVTVTADAIREARLRQREIDRELTRLEAERTANPPRKMEVRIDLATDAATAATLRVSYTVRGARWAPIYDARLDSGRAGRPASLELIRRAEIVQSTGEDWTDVALAVSTVRTAKGGNAPDLRPLIVRYPAPPRTMSMAPARQERIDQMSRDRIPDGLAYSPAAPAPAGRVEKAEESEAVVETDAFQVVFRVPGRIDVPANEGPKNFRIAGATLAPDLLVRAVPALDETAFLEASFKQGDEAPLLPGRTSLYRDGVFVGRGQMALTRKDEMVRLGFGADDRVKVARATVRKVEAQTGIISTAKTDEREYKITVKNGHDTAMRIVVEDQIPVSEVADVRVELLPGTTEPTERDLRDRRGVLAWSFDAKAGETRDIKLGWRVRWPSDKTVEFVAGRP
jgi:uncharacterized protein (TIGR02231 family)